MTDQQKLERPAALTVAFGLSVVIAGMTLYRSWMLPLYLSLRIAWQPKGVLIEW